MDHKMLNASQMPKDRSTAVLKMANHRGQKLAFQKTPGREPMLVFLGGFRSDMMGTKAEYLEAYARKSGQAFLRFDYSGHGMSEGSFEEGTIGQWCEDALDIIKAQALGRVVLIGSSMGGWIAFLLARAIPDRIAGIVTIAAAPDFTRIGFEASFSEQDRADLARNGRVLRESEYGEALVITENLILDGAKHLVFDQELKLPMPVHMLQGTMDEDVPVEWALRLLDHAQGESIELTLLKGADHRFSSPQALRLLTDCIEASLSHIGKKEVTE